MDGSNLPRTFHQLPDLLIRCAQIYACFNKPVRLSALKKWLPKAHWEARRGSHAQAKAYCQKEDTRVAGPWERGDDTLVGQGKRNDLREAADLIAKGATMKDLAMEVPTAVVKFHHGLERLIDLRKPKIADKTFEPRPWQRDIMDDLFQDPDDRTIMWLFDQLGGQGKSRLASHLIKDHGAVLLEGRMQDMALVYTQADCPRIVLFDITRGAAECSDHLYSFAEKLKNGHITSTKYNSKAVTFDPPHVVFMANFMPDMSKWSKDRYNIIDLGSYKPRARLQPQPSLTASEIDQVLEQTFRDMGDPFRQGFA